MTSNENAMTKVEPKIKRRKIGLKYELQTDDKRINIMYDLIHLKRSPTELIMRYDINYNTIKNVQNLYAQ